MSANNDNKAQAAADKIKAAALSATKGLSRAQAERAATAAARNVNAYGQKEEGPSRWQEKREAKRQMYLMSTEKQVRLGERKDLNKPAVLNVNSSAQCQKCYQTGHWTYECKNERVYIARPSRTQQLKNPKLRMKLSVEYDLDNGGSSRVDEEVKIGKGKNQMKKKNKNKRKYRSNSDSGSDSEASVFETDSGSSSVTLTGSESDSEESSYCSSSDSEEERRRRRRKKKKQQERRKERRRRYSSSSSGTESDSVSGSESDSDDDKSRRRKRRHSRRR